MSAPIISARGIARGRHGISNRGKTPAIGVAVVALVVGGHALTRHGAPSSAENTITLPSAGDVATAVQPVCTDAPGRSPICYMPKADGVWVAETLQADGRWARSAMQIHPPGLEELQRGYSG
jgi:hypothetical protein